MFSYSGYALNRYRQPSRKTYIVGYKAGAKLGLLLHRKLPATDDFSFKENVSTWLRTIAENYLGTDYDRELFNRGLKDGMHDTYAGKYVEFLLN